MTTLNLNLQRAERCQEFLATYDGDDEAKLVQLLADARHWCDSEERDYALLDRVAQEHYLSDLTEEPADEA